MQKNGAAAPFIKDYLALAMEATKEHHMPVYDHPHAMYPNQRGLRAVDNTIADEKIREITDSTLALTVLLPVNASARTEINKKFSLVPNDVQKRLLYYITVYSLSEPEKYRRPHPVRICAFVLPGTVTWGQNTYITYAPRAAVFP